MTKINFATLSLLTLILIISSGSQAQSAEPKANIVVPANYLTVREAIEASKPGDIILINPGEYEEKEGLRLKDGITLLGSGADVTKIKTGRDGLIFEDIQKRTAVSKIEIKNLTFILESQPVFLKYVEDAELKNCIITGTGSIGICIVASKKIEITNCTISGFNAGMSLWQGPSEVTIRNSIMAGNRIYNIFIDDLSNASFGLTNPVTGQSVSEEQQAKILAERKNRKLSLFYNDVWGAMENYHNCAPGEFDISQNPQFLGGGDFHLQSGSPCIDAGDPDSKYNDPDGTRSDLGALPFSQIESNN